MSARKTSSGSFEKSLADLEKIVERMEKGDQTLDQTIADFEKGMALSRQCQKSLDEAQLKVEKLVSRHGGLEPDDFDLEPLDQDDDGDGDPG